MWKEPSSLRSTKRLSICRDMGVDSGSEGLSLGPSSYITKEYMIHRYRYGVQYLKLFLIKLHSPFCLYSTDTFRLMCVSRIVISIGSMWEVELSSRKMERLCRDVMRKSALKACSWHCRKPLCSARGEWAAASGPLSSRSRTSGSCCLLRGSWSEPEPDTHTI